MTSPWFNQKLCEITPDSVADAILDMMNFDNLELQEALLQSLCLITQTFFVDDGILFLVVHYYVFQYF